MSLQACRILWGALYDRIGYRKCVITIGVFVTAGVSALPLLKYLGESADILQGRLTMRWRGKLYNLQF